HRFDYLKKIIASPNRDYYFVRAWQECKINHLSLPTANTLFPPRDYSSHISDGQLKEPAHWTKYLLFRQYDCPANAEFELREFRRENPDSPDLLLEFSRFYASTKKYQQSILHAIYFQTNQPDATQYRNVCKKVYPIFFLKEIETWGKKYAVDPYLILSLIRTESTFAPEDVSTSGAIGLMQIMPATALWMVETKKSEVVPLEQWDPQLLRQPEINLRLGVDYFGYLMKYFTGKLCPAICAYNGGPDRVKTWLQERKTDDFDVFIEEIPYLETKNYIKKVMTFYFHYSLIYRGRFPLTPCIF
ncbi:MAG: lytic transglycosylase domain-containing protein, partial [Atribacterota bacterium]